MAPWLLYGLGAYSLYEMGQALSRGRDAEGVVHAIGGVLSIVGANAPRSSHFAKLQKDTYIARWCRLWKSREQIADEVAAVIRREQEFEEARLREIRRRDRLLKIVHTMADRLGFPRDRLHINPHLTSETMNFGPGVEAGGEITMQLALYRHRLRRDTGWVGEIVRDHLRVYPKLSTAVAHEVSHAMHGTGHLGPEPFGRPHIWGDASFRALEAFWFQHRLISEPCARALVRSIAPEYHYEYNGRITLDLLGEPPLRNPGAP